MHRYAQAFAIANLLAAQHMIAHLHQRLAGCADMLLHGQHNLLGHDGVEGGYMGGHFLVVLGMDATEKQAFHEFTSFKF